MMRSSPHASAAGRVQPEVKCATALLLLAGCAALPPAEIMDFTVPERVFAGDEVRLSARVRSEGPVRIHVAREGGVVLSREFAGEGERAIDWSFSVSEPGTYGVVVGSGATGRVALLEVKAAPVRVLYVERPPRFEYRFLKKALLRDESLRVHCLLTSADPGWPQEHTEGFDGSPSKFPDDLSKYEVVVMGDETPPVHLARFVREGGGLVVIPGRTRWTGALDALLPVAIDGETPEGMELAARLTELGRGFLPFDFTAETKPLRWMLTSKSRDGAKVLAEADGHPLFVTWTAGKGRVFWSATDETWIWRYLSGDEPYFYPLWRRAIGWAAAGK
jgi:hypothetical protein